MPPPSAAGDLPLVIGTAESWPEWGLAMVLLMSILIPVFLAVSFASTGAIRGFVLAVTLVCFAPILLLGFLLVLFGRRIPRKLPPPGSPPPQGFA